MDEADFCPSCGEVFPVIGTLRRQVADQAAAVNDLAVQLAAARGQVRKLRAERDFGPETDPYEADGRRVFEYWKAILAPGAREFTDDRRKRVLARLKAGASAEELCRAIDGAARFPYVTDAGRAPTGTKRQRQVELELICRSEAHVMRFINYGEPDSPAEGSRPITFERLAAAQTALDNPRILARLHALRGWDGAVIVELGLGLERGRVVFPIRDAAGELVGAHRYQPNPDVRSGPKMIASGSRDLFPAPETVDASSVWLVEGEPDAVAIQSAGLPGVGVPGVATWKDGWAERFDRFDRVYICFDCDEEGRAAAQARLASLGPITSATVVDLDPNRNNGYDVGDLVRERGPEAAAELVRRAVPSSGSVTPMQHRPAEDPVERVIRALEDRDLRVKAGPGDTWTAQCPRHDDRTPSMTVSRGKDGRVLLHCFAGCDTTDVVAALGLEMKDLFAA